MASLRPAEAGAYAGMGLLAGAGLALASAGPGMVAAATWLEARDAGIPSWLLGPFGQGLGLGGTGFYILLGLAFAGYLLVLAGARRLSIGSIWLLGAFLLGVFVAAPPLLSQDVFSYIAYARMGAEHGLNPYELGPDAIGSDPVFAFVGWPDAVSVYGPVFTLASYSLAPLSLPASVWALKAVAALSLAATAALCGRVAAWRGIDPVMATAFVLFNPLALVHVVGGGHNDGLIALGVAGAVALVLSSREASGGALLALSAAVKLSALFMAPFALLGSARRFRVLAGGLAAATAVAAVAAAAFGSAALESVALVDSNQSATTRYSLPATVSRLIGSDPDPVRYAFLAGFALVVGGLCLNVWRGGDWVRAAGWAGLGMLLATGWLLPWYLVWILPVVALSRDRALLLATLALTGFQLISRIPF